jgi:EAL domain-containing protein (putative c-di-GMP-specific phosphodiesterase class I)
VQIAHSVGKSTVAEFVENVEMLRMLKEAGVDYVQGFYIAKPKHISVETRTNTVYPLENKS